MARLRFPGVEDETDRVPEPLPFPEQQPAKTARPEPDNPMGFVGPDGARRFPEVEDAFEQVSRRMEDLARVLGCFGFFDDDDDDRPTAA